MGHLKSNKKTHLHLRKRGHTFAQKTAVSVKTHATPIQGNILFKPKAGQNKILEDYVMKLVKEYHTSNIAVGIIPLVNNVNKKYTSLVIKCQKRMRQEDINYSHIPYVAESSDLFWGLSKIIEFRTQIQNQPKAKPVIVIVDSKFITAQAQYSKITFLLKKGPEVGLYFLITDSSGKLFDPKLFSKVI
jgi:hypothetical protein